MSDLRYLIDFVGHYPGDLLLGDSVLRDLALGDPELRDLA